MNADKIADWRDCERMLIAATEDETITPEVANVMYQAATYLRQAADEAVQPAQAAQPVGVPDGLIGALRYQRQIDEDGQEVGVSRQAVDEAIEILESLTAPQPPAQPSADAEELIEAASAYFNGYCVDEADDWFDDGERVGENTGVTREQCAAANRLRDAINRMRPKAARAAEGDGNGK